MNILVTGGAGFIGSNFVHYMLQSYETYKIINYDSNSKIVANLLVLDKKVIGGDISETKKDGFMQTFYKNK